MSVLILFLTCLIFARAQDALVFGDFLLVCFNDPRAFLQANAADVPAAPGGTIASGSTSVFSLGAASASSFPGDVRFLSDGTVLACNRDVLKRIDPATENVLETFTPDVSMNLGLVTQCATDAADAVYVAVRDTARGVEKRTLDSGVDPSSGTATLERTFRDPMSPIEYHGVEVTPSGRLVACGDTRCDVFDATSTSDPVTPLFSFVPAPGTGGSLAGQPRAVAFEPRSGGVIVTFGDGTTEPKLFDVSGMSGVNLANYTSVDGTNCLGNNLGVTIDNDGDALITRFGGNNNGRICKLDVTTGAVVSTITIAQCGKLVGMVQVGACDVDTTAATVDNLAGDCICGDDQESDGASACTVINQATCAQAETDTSDCNSGELDLSFSGQPTLCFALSPVANPTTATLSNAAAVTFDGLTIAPGTVFSVLFSDISSDGLFWFAATLEDTGSGDIIEWFPSGGSCQILGETVTPASKRKRQPSGDLTGASAASLVANSASAFGDPHLRGPFPGQTFDFNGQNGGMYTLFSAPHFSLIVQIEQEGAQHFMTRVGVTFRGVAEIFTLKGQRSPARFMQNLNRKLRARGGSAKYPIPNHQAVLELELCHGHRVTLSKMVTIDGKRHTYFNVVVHVPGCHDEFDGVLGRAYQCKYEHGKTRFAFDASVQESFRVKRLTTTFDKTSAPCRNLSSHVNGTVSGHVYH